MATTTCSLFPPPTVSAGPTRTHVNDDVYVAEDDGLCVVWVHGSPWHRFAARNKLDRRVVGASLVVAGLARSAEVERGLGLNHDTLYRDRKRMMEGGLTALATVKRGPKGATKATPDLTARAKRLWQEGEHSKREIARKLGVSRETARRMLQGVPAPDPEPVQSTFAPEAADLAVKDAEPSEASSEAVGSAAAPEGKAERASPAAFMPRAPHPETTEDDLDRTAERVWARFGLLDEAEVRFVSGDDLRFVDLC